MVKTLRRIGVVCTAEVFVKLSTPDVGSFAFSEPVYKSFSNLLPLGRAHEDRLSDAGAAGRCHRGVYRVPGLHHRYSSMQVYRHRSTSGLRFGTSGSSCSEASGVFGTDTLGILFRSRGIVSSLRKNTVIYSLVQVPLVVRVGGTIGRK